MVVVVVVVRGKRRSGSAPAPKAGERGCERPSGRAAEPSKQACATRQNSWWWMTAMQKPVKPMSAASPQPKDASGRGAPAPSD